jgi:hypothetical protein
MVLAGTTTDTGIASAAGLLDPSATVLPPAGAARFSVTVHVVVAPDGRLAGAHASDETLGLGGVTVTVAVLLAPSVAVTATVCAVATNAAVALNVAEFVAAATVTEAGMGSAVVLFEASATVLPLAGAARSRVTVHVVEAPDVTLVGLQTSEDTLGLMGATVTAAAALAPSVAVRVTV